MWSSSLTAKLSCSRVAAAVEVPVDLQEHRPFLQREPRVGVRLVDDDRSPIGSDVQELASIAPAGDVDDDVERFARRFEGALDAGVEARRDD